ncbi:MAG: ECF transporter S component [Lachnospiraceae bacterium]|nr:ECF transporter S component [Lachnospiraceae bacterium]
MDNLTNSEKKVRVLLLAALTCVATMIVKLPIPGNGYVNLGDGFMLACGMILGPLPGALAAGTGSALADLINGYSYIAPATFVIKALSATVAAFVYRILARKYVIARYSYMDVSIAGAAGELFMIIGYYAYDVFRIIYGSDRLSRTILSQASRTAAVSLPYNLLQAAIGVTITAVATPLLAKLLIRGK